MATRTKSAATDTVMDAEVIDEAPAPVVRSERFDQDFSKAVDVIGELTPEQLDSLPGLYTEGFTLVNKGELLGVPFTVTAVTFWAPAAAKTPSGYRLGYVSCEATVASIDQLERLISAGRILRRVENGNGAADTRVISSVDELTFFPGERVVFNDESTGIRRTIVGWLDKLGLAKIPATHPKHEGNRLDMPWPLWDDFAESTEQGPKGVVPRFTRMPNGNPFIIHARRGLRVSEYSNDYTDDGVTYYFG